MTRPITFSSAAISLAAAAALAIVPIYGSVETFPVAHREPITVRILSGKSGLPLPHLHLLLIAGYDKTDVRQQLFQEEVITDAKGQVRLSNKIANLPWLQVWVKRKPLCQDYPRQASFSVELMRRDGLSTPNHCGIVTVDEVPGTFNVFVKGTPKNIHEKSSNELPQSPIEHTRFLTPSSPQPPTALPSDAGTPRHLSVSQEEPGLRSSSENGVSRPDATQAPQQNLDSVEIPTPQMVVSGVATQQPVIALGAPLSSHFPGAPTEVLWTKPAASSEAAIKEQKSGQSFVFVPAPALPDAATRTKITAPAAKTAKEETKKPRKMQSGDEKSDEKLRSARRAIHSRHRAVHPAQLVSQKSKPRPRRAKQAAPLCPAPAAATKPMSVASDKPPVTETKPAAVAAKTAPVATKPTAPVATRPATAVAAKPAAALAAKPPVIAVPVKPANTPVNASAPADTTFKPKPSAGVKLVPPAAPAPAANSSAKPKP